MAGGRKKYEAVYAYYRDLIRSGGLKEGAKLPSIRQLSEQLHYSRTTVEAAYMLLSADGYIISRPQSGYYVTGHQGSSPSGGAVPGKMQPARSFRYNLAVAGADRQSFRFGLWRRYMHSALRQDERLIHYGEPQGEQDLREELAAYLSSERSVVCGAGSIVIGAGTQSLLQILCPILAERRRVEFWGAAFGQGQRIFEDYGFRIGDASPGGILYATPSRMTERGDVMPVQERIAFLRRMASENVLILEDDYNSEFIYKSRTVPSLQGLSEGRNVIYLGTFSGMLLPSIRLSFMVLPEDLLALYRERAHLYNQTASKAEQIALCRYMRDGNLIAQIRKTRRHYAAKQEAFCREAEGVFGELAHIKPAEAGFFTAVEFRTPLSGARLREMAERRGIAVRCPDDSKPELLLSWTAFDQEEYREVLTALREAIAGAFAQQGTGGREE